MTMSDFDPTLFNDPAMPASVDAFRVDGLREHLKRYSGQLSPGHAIARLDDPAWRDAWDAALAPLAGQRVLLRGSELGLLGLRARRHGAAHVRCLEAFALDARIAGGIVQKHLLGPWHARHGAAIAGWSDAERRASFEAFAAGIDIDVANMADATAKAEPVDCVVFPALDHTLLGTGIVRALRDQPARRVLPARARVFAMGVQWRYPGAGFVLDAVNPLRRSLYPQPLDAGSGGWTALTPPQPVGEIDFGAFAETTWSCTLPVTMDGTLDAIVFWYELDLGAAGIGNAPDGPLRCIRPAVQGVVAQPVRTGEGLALQVRVEETRLHFRMPAASAAAARPHALPGWYAPMLADEPRNEAYREAIARALAARPADLVLDIGAGCGLLSMMAAEAGAPRVVGCESDPVIAEAGRQVIARNGLDGPVTLLTRDCRQLAVPTDLPRRADLALFELFDCSLIGEGVLHVLAFAREHLLAPTARLVPCAARLRAMLVEYRVDRLWDVDVNLLNPYRAPTAFANVDATRLDWRALSEPFDVFSFDFARAGPTPDEIALDLRASAAGTVGAVLFWFDLGLDDAHWLSNAPGTALHWKQGLQALPELRVENGAALPLAARHDGSGLSFQWAKDALPADAFSPLPRWDPRWLAASAELEQSSQRLLQHCAQHPDEFAKVAEIAARFAVDPARHGLDPVIAQRFAALFLREPRSAT